MKMAVAFVRASGFHMLPCIPACVIRASAPFPAHARSWLSLQGMVLQTAFLPPLVLHLTLLSLNWGFFLKPCWAHSNNRLAWSLNFQSRQLYTHWWQYHLLSHRQSPASPFWGPCFSLELWKQVDQQQEVWPPRKLLTESFWPQHPHLQRRVGLGHWSSWQLWSMALKELKTAELEGTVETTQA